MCASVCDSDIHDDERERTGMNERNREKKPTEQMKTENEWVSVQNCRQALVVVTHAMHGHTHPHATSEPWRLGQFGMSPMCQFQLTFLAGKTTFTSENVCVTSDGSIKAVLRESSYTRIQLKIKTQNSVIVSGLIMAIFQCMLVQRIQAVVFVTLNPSFQCFQAQNNFLFGMNNPFGMSRHSVIFIYPCVDLNHFLTYSTQTRTQKI